MVALIMLWSDGIVPVSCMEPSSTAATTSNSRTGNGGEVAM